jgi:hypothetical protein
MENKNNQLSIIAQTLNETALSVLGNNTLMGFERAYQMATAIEKLNELLTPEYMRPIMALQGNRLGFLTDKDKSGGYPEPVVKKCLIEAVLMGLQPYGNQFNIIASNTYATKEGCGYRLNNTTGLKYDIVCSLPKISGTSAAVDVTIKWSINGQSNEKIIPIPIKIDSYTGVDAIIGKATRKARAWLLSNITGIEVTDADVTDAVIIEEKPKANKEQERLKALIESATTVEELISYEAAVKELNVPEITDLYKQKSASY